MGEVLLKASGPTNPIININQYDQGLLNTVVYPVNGGLEDWAYAGSWEDSVTDNKKPVIPKCSSAPLSASTYGSDEVRSMLFLVETDDDKYPLEKGLGSPAGVWSRSPETFGHVPRNIALCLALIEMTDIYIKFKENKNECLLFYFFTNEII